MAREQIYHIIKRHMECVKAGVPSFCHTILAGPTGSGKTYTIIKALEYYGADIPVIKIDANQLAPPGWKGSSLMDVLDEYRSHPHFEESIIYIDEFDKIVSNNKDSHADYMVSLQTALLQLLDKTPELALFPGRDHGRSKGAIEPFSTYNITCIFSGVFREVTQRPTNAMGFNTKQSDVSTQKSEITHEGLVGLGFMRELVYRVPYIIEVSPYGREELRGILQSHFGYRQAVDLFGLKIDEEKMIDFITNHPAGARAIQLYISQQDLEWERGLLNE